MSLVSKQSIVIPWQSSTDRYFTGSGHASSFPATYYLIPITSAYITQCFSNWCYINVFWFVGLISQSINCLMDLQCLLQLCYCYCADLAGTLMVKCVSGTWIYLQQPTCCTVWTLQVSLSVIQMSRRQPVHQWTRIGRRSERYRADIVYAFCNIEIFINVLNYISSLFSALTLLDGCHKGHQSFHLSDLACRVFLETFIDHGC